MKNKYSKVNDAQPDHDVPADAPFRDDDAQPETESAAPREIIYSENDGTEPDETPRPAPVEQTLSADDGEAFMQIVPEHVAAAQTVIDKPEPAIEKAGKGKKPKGDMIVIPSGTELDPETRPWTKAEAEAEDKVMTRDGKDLFKRADLFRAKVLEFDRRLGWLQLGFKNVQEWAKDRYGIQGKGVYAELTAARTQEILNAVIEKANDAGNEVPVPNKVPRDILLAIKGIDAEKIPEVMEEAYTLAEAEAKPGTKVESSAKNVKAALVKLGLKPAKANNARKPDLSFLDSKPTLPAVIGNALDPAPEQRTEAADYNPALDLINTMYEPSEQVLTFFLTSKAGMQYSLTVTKGELPANLFAS